MQCGMEVVLPNGELVRTGMGAMPGNNTWQLFKYGFGPYVDGMFSQSNFGIVTKMGIWLMPEPPGYRPYMIIFQREEDLEQVVEILRPLQGRSTSSRTPPRIRSLLLGGRHQRDQSQYSQWPGPIPDSAREEDHGRPGHRHVEFLRCAVRAAAGHGYAVDGHPRFLRHRCPARSSTSRRTARHETDMLMHRAETMRGIPRLTEFSFVNWIGGGGHIGFSPVSPITRQRRR